MKTSDYKDLKIWNKAIDLTVEVYDIVKLFPKEEMYALSDQLRRAVVSVASNIAEGHGRISDVEFIRFLSISRGSLYEVETQLTIATRLMYVRPERISKVMAMITEISKMINSLISYLSPKSTPSNHNTSPKL